MSVVLRELDAPSRGEGSASPRLAGRVGGYLFIGGALLTATATLLPLPDGVDRAGYWLLAFAQLVLGGLMLVSDRFDGLAAARLRAVVITGSVLAISAAILFSGVGTDGAAVLSVFYVLPAIYVGYFFRGPAIIAVVIASTVAYCAASADVGVAASAVVIRGLVMFSVLAGAAGAVHIVRLHVDELVERLDRLARVDSLTALLNRRGFDESLTAELDRFRRDGRPLSLAIGDIDRFKVINDRFGHAAGDHVLCEIGRAFDAAVRSVDTVARIGGEEFALLMPDTEPGAAIEVVDRLRLEIADISDPLGKSVEITFGLASTEDPVCQEAAALLLAADRALYSGKATGRNSTVLHERGATRGPRLFDETAIAG